MINEKLIINLIKQDFKHNQLLRGIEALGFDDRGNNSLEIMEIVAEMMGVIDGKTRDKWIEIYLIYQDRVTHYIISDTGSELRPLASECYHALKSHS